MASVTCPNCGLVNHGGRSFCKQCRTPLSAAPGAPAVQAASAVAAVSADGYSYLVVPFQGQVGGGAKASVAIQLQQAIDAYVAQGWDYYRMDKVNIRVSPGCLGGLLGASETYVTYDHIIFRRQP